MVVLTWGALEGDNESRSLEATTRDVSGERSGAFVSLGSARRVTVEFRGFPVAPEEGCAKSPAPPGVGVDGTTVAALLGFVARFLGGVTGTAASGALRFLLAGGADFGSGSGSSFGTAWALRRAERLVTAMVCEAAVKFLCVVRPS